MLATYIRNLIFFLIGFVLQEKGILAWFVTDHHLVVYIILKSRNNTNL